jgi:tRNA pseudouridine55 synthase
VGTIEQVPPMHSAVKVDGERLYARARRGEVVERAPRRITIHALRRVSWDSPRLLLHVHCSKGTYVRTLAHDLGNRLGCYGHLSALRRIRAGPFRIEAAIPLETLLHRCQADGPAFLSGDLIGLSQALRDMPELRLDAARERKTLNGQPLDEKDLSLLGAPPFAAGTHVRLIGADDRLVAIGTASPHGVRYQRVLHRLP